jgi:hypothetical protein
MSVRTIPSSSGLPPLRLPPGALSPEDRQYEHDPATEPSAIEPIEHKLRVDLMTAGIPDAKAQLLGSYNHYNAGPDDDDPWQSKSHEKPLALQYAERTIEQHWASEQEYFDNYDSDEVLEDAPAYLAQQLREARDAAFPDEKAAEECEKRKKWYDLMPWKNLYAVFKQDSLGELIESEYRWPSQTVALNGTAHEQATFVGVLVIPNDSDERTVANQYGVNPEFVYKEQEFASRGNTDLTTPTDYGFELPAPLVMVKYPNGSNYLFIPWCSGLVCQGPFKQNKPYRVMCKHEALAAFVLSQQDGITLPIDEGIHVPARARRFIDPEIATRHTSEQ